MNSKRQGDIGVAAATLYYTKLGYTVSYPMSDAARYDLVVDIDGKLLRVQCKTSTHRDKSCYKVQLATSGGNRSWSGVRKKISSDECDIIFIWCANGSLWEIPAEELHDKSSFRAGPKNVRFLVEGDLPPTQTTEHPTQTPRVKKDRPQKIEWPQLDELEALVVYLGYSGAGRELGVSDNAIRKHIKRCRLLLVE